MLFREVFRNFLSKLNQKRLQDDNCGYDFL